MRNEEGRLKPVVLISSVDENPRYAKAISHAVHHFVTSGCEV